MTQSESEKTTLADIIELRKAFGRADMKTVWLSLPALFDEITRLRAERPGWLTMESAPKDGTLVLLHEDCIPASVQIGRWEEDGECWAADPGGWSIEVAMWQPLPALHPSVAEGREDNNAPANRGPV